MRAVAVLLAALASWPASGGESYLPSVLIVTAHPDDEYCMAATTVRIARELGGKVDQVVITNGEAGFKFSTPAEQIYSRELVKEEAGRRELPALRAGELEASDKVLGIREHELLGEKDFGFTLDVAESLSKWDKEKILKALKRRLSAGHYDFVMGLLPLSVEHGHHKAATLLALEAIAGLPAEGRPLFLGCWATPASPRDDEQKAQVASAKSYIGVPGFPISFPDRGAGEFRFDRRRPFGFKDKLNYQVWVNWMIAEHKSQGLFQMMVGRDEFENFLILGAGDGKARAQKLFSAINAR